MHSFIKCSLFLITIAVSPWFLTGCGDNPSSPGSLLVPNIGSTYTVAGYNTNADGSI